MGEERKETKPATTDFEAAYKRGQESGGFELVKKEDITPFTILPEHLRVESLEKYLPAPLRIESTPGFDDAASFIEYVNRFSDEGTRLFAKVENAGKTSFIAILDYHLDQQGDDLDKTVPRWGKHRATYECPFSQEWTVWIGANTKTMEHKKFIEFIETNLLDIISPTQAEMLESVRDFRLKKSVEFDSAINTTNGMVQFAYREKADAPVGHASIPAEFTIRIPVFKSSPNQPVGLYEMSARLRYTLDGGKLTLFLELIRPHKVLDAAFTEVFTQIQTGTGIKVLLGNP